MKITGIEIGEYRQFKNIKFDFTYPKDHPKAGQPLEKVCFIGQSGTGKTTLLNIIGDFFQVVNDGFQILSNNFSVLSVTHYEAFKNDISIRILVQDEHIEFSKKDIIEPSEPYINDTKIIAGSSFNWVKRYDFHENVKHCNKFCIFIKDSIAREADAFLFDQKDQPQTFSDFVKTDTQIEKEKVTREERIQEAGLKKVVSLGDLQSLSIWQYLLKDIDNYDEASRTLVMNLMQGAQSATASKVVEELQKWIVDTPNARIELAERCLNPILNNFFLEVDTNAGNVPIALRTKQGTKIDSSYLSTGTRQLLATAIPLYKFDTTDTVILFDEPERSLFPDIQRILVDYYISLAPKAQFFFATHSPIIASAFEPCERFILHFDENGEVKCHTGIAPEGDDPNDILRQDFDMAELMLQKGLEAYDEYRRLAMAIRAETDEEKKDQLIIERLELGNRYNFAGQYAQSK